MSALAAALRDEIRRNGPVTLARYMEQALHHPTWGYYRSRDPLGAAGDFTTAPEISQMFGEMIGVWLAVLWQQMGSPAAVRLIELGPGRGTLMSDALRATHAVPGFHPALDLHLIETSEPLRAAQARSLATVNVKATWHDTIADVPAGPLLLIANEFLDALPIHQFQRAAQGWRERLVAEDESDETRFRFVLSEADAVITLPALLRDAPPGTIWETSPPSHAVIRSVAGRIARDGGGALFIDYGYARQSGGDSLQALRAHRTHDPLTAPGDADITAHVNFTALAQSAQDAGARAYGPVDQGPFLLGLGLETRAEHLRTASLARNRLDQAAAVATAFKRLIAPTEMGSLFKVLALAGPKQPTPPGFTDVSQAEPS
jgi:NADH dehydrogenase [ubiquinone] 1 alpha subcomplex assembly factor 7